MLFCLIMHGPYDGRRMMCTFAKVPWEDCWGCFAVGRAKPLKVASCLKPFLHVIACSAASGCQILGQTKSQGQLDCPGAKFSASSFQALLFCPRWVATQYVVRPDEGRQVVRGTCTFRSRAMWIKALPHVVELQVGARPETAAATAKSAGEYLRHKGFSCKAARKSWFARSEIVLILCRTLIKNYHSRNRSWLRSSFLMSSTIQLVRFRGMCFVVQLCDYIMRVRKRESGQSVNVGQMTVCRAFGFVLKRITHDESALKSFELQCWVSDDSFVR